MAPSLLVTAVGCGLFLLLGQVPLPGITDVDHGWGAHHGPAYTLALLGMRPILSGWILVELVALAVPSLRERRVGGAQARAPLRRAATVVALLAATGQAGGFATSASMVSYYQVDRVVLVVSLVGATAFVLWVARWIDRAGFGGGMVALLATEGAASLPQLSFATVEEPVVAVGGSVLAIAALVGLARTEGLTPTTGSSRLWQLAIPICGVYPLLAVDALYQVPGISGAIRGWSPITLDGLESLVIAMTAVALGWVFHRPRRVAAAWLARTPPWPRALLGSAVGLVILNLVTVHSSAVEVGITAGMLLSAAVLFLDWTDEARFRATHGAVVRLDELHRPYMVPPVLAAIEVAGVSAHVRSVRVRALTQSLGAFVPMTVLVPEGAVDAAHQALANVRRG